EGPAVAGDCTADTTVAEDAQRPAAQRLTYADLPPSSLQRGHLLRQGARRGEQERPRELGRGIRRSICVLRRGHDDSEPRTGVDVDVRIDAALADAQETRQALQQGRADLCALAD